MKIVVLSLLAIIAIILVVFLIIVIRSQKSRDALLEEWLKATEKAWLESHAEINRKTSEK